MQPLAFRLSLRQICRVPPWLLILLNLTIQLFRFDFNFEGELSTLDLQKLITSETKWPGMLSGMNWKNDSLSNFIVKCELYSEQVCDRERHHTNYWEILKRRLPYVRNSITRPTSIEYVHNYTIMRIYIFIASLSHVDANLISILQPFPCMCIY